MIVWGMSKNSHDWAIAVFKDGEHIHTMHGKGKSHPLHMVAKARDLGHPELVVWYENPYLKSLRQLIAGQPKPFRRNNIKRYLRDLNINCKWTYVGHHESHAAAFYKSGFQDATIVVLDSIGEFDCTSIWHAKDGKMKKLESAKYPHSLGLFYSAMTDRIGLKPQRDESTFERLSKESHLPFSMLETRMEIDLVKQFTPLPKFKKNLHRGVRGMWPDYSNKEIARAARIIFEQMISAVFWQAKNLSDSKNVVVSGGVAFNGCIQTKAEQRWDNVYIPPNPSDTGSAEGAVLAYLNNGK